ncbi:MAG: hypothetical protein HY665_07910 [Chloroflexi bacterium]|nr:hypothetical protein [Chloroflexota bacterium]
MQKDCPSGSDHITDMENDESMLNDHLILETASAPPRAERLSLCIGGISCSIMSQDTAFLDLLRQRYQWFEMSGPATYEILLQLTPADELISSNSAESSPEVKRINSGDNYLIRQAHNPFVAVVNVLSKKALVKLWNSEFSFDNFLRILYSLILVKEGGLLLHASSVSDGGRGRVFFGPSGSGKTTIAQLSGGRTVLTDELALIRPRDSGYRVYGTPFWGEFKPGKSNGRAELAGLYALKKDQSNCIVPIDKVQAVTELYRCVLFFSHELPLLSRILDTCCALVDAIPVYELHFQRDPAFWEVLNGTK